MAVIKPSKVVVSSQADTSNVIKAINLGSKTVEVLKVENGYTYRIQPDFNLSKKTYRSIKQALDMGIKEVKSSYAR